MKKKSSTNLKRHWRHYDKIRPSNHNGASKRTMTAKIRFGLALKGISQYQYITSRLMTSANLSDSKAAIPLFKKVEDQFPKHFTTAILDAGYDFEPIYQFMYPEYLVLNVGNNSIKNVAL